MFITSKFMKAESSDPLNACHPFSVPVSFPVYWMQTNISSIRVSIKSVERQSNALKNNVAFSFSFPSSTSNLSADSARLTLICSATLNPDMGGNFSILNFVPLIWNLVSPKFLIFFINASIIGFGLLFGV